MLYFAVRGLAELNGEGRVTREQFASAGTDLIAQWTAWARAHGFIK